MIYTHEHLLIINKNVFLNYFGALCHRIKVTRLVVEQSINALELNQFTTVQNQYSIIVNDRVQSMSYGQHGAVGECRAYRSLNQLVRAVVHRGAGLVQYEYFGFAEQSSRQTNELSLANTLKCQFNFIKLYSKIKKKI